MGCGLMPQICDNKEIRVVLPSDQRKAKDIPAFIYRPLNGKEFIKVAEVNDAMLSGNLAIAERLDLVYKTAQVGLVGWENMNNPATGRDFPFDPETLDMIVNPFEVQELIEQVLQAMQPSYDVKKKSGLSPASEED